MKIFIGICNSQDFMPSNFFWSITRLMGKWTTRLYRSGHVWDVVRNNQIIDQFLKSDCDVLAKMDIDQMYPPNYFERLVPLVEQFKVAGPMIYDRWDQNGYMPLAFQKVDGLKLYPMDIVKHLSGVVDIPFPHTNLLYHREVLEKIPPPWYEAHLREDGLERANHVDYTFIEKIHKAGYRTMIDLDCVVKHMAVKWIGREECQL